MTANLPRTLPATKHAMDFSPHHQPAYYLAPGERVCVETLCSASGSVRRSAKAANNDELREKVGWLRGMPMTGPIFIDGSAPGDALAVHVDQIDVANSGWTDVMIGRGAAGHLIAEAEVRTFRILDGMIDFGFGVRLPLRPMIGAIGTAPSAGAVSAGIPGAHGGNLDCTLVRPNSTLYLPVNVEGALLGLGDLHAAMGDGEVGNAGLEVAGSVTLQVTIVRDHTLPLPLIETSETVSAVASGENLESAARQAVEAMVRWITRETEIRTNAATMLVSFAGDLRICQIVNPLVTCRLDMPKEVLESLGLWPCRFSPALEDDSHS